MTPYRGYDAGELRVLRRVLSRADQLANKANFESEGELFLVRCMACSDDPRGRENYMAASASGCCAWCGWGQE